MSPVGAGSAALGAAALGAAGAALGAGAATGAAGAAPLASSNYITNKSSIKLSFESDFEILFKDLLA